MDNHRVYSMAVADVYPHYVTKAEKKGRTKEEVDRIICWLFGYTQEQIEQLLADGTDFRSFVENAPHINPNRTMITGTICGIRVEQMEQSIMKEIRYLDKLVDELAKGKAMDKILRV